MSLPRRAHHSAHSFVVLSLALTASAPLRAHEPEVVTEEHAQRPTPRPDRIILTFAGDPKTTIGVTWRTAATATKALAQLAPATDGPAFQAALKPFEARTEPFESAAGKAHYHSVIFKDLEPGRTYVYRVGDGNNWSEFFQFRTQPAELQPFAFVYFGDAQNDLRSLWSRVIRESALATAKPAFFVHAGDLVNRHVNDHEWGEWFGAGGWLNGMIPSVPAAGNHEYSRGPDNKPQLTPHWSVQFTLPENGPEPLRDSVYFVDYQNVRLVVLNSNQDHPVQAAWLDTVLSDPKRPLWTVITFHHPIFSVSKGRDNTALREAWQPVFDRHKVDLVLQGHDHSYARSGPRLFENVPTGQQVRRAVAGTVYVVSVSGPKMYQVGPQPWMLRSAEDTQLYQIIRVDADRLDYEAHTATGALYDRFLLRKRAPGEPAEFLDLQPNTPENRRPEPAAAKTAG